MASDGVGRISMACQCMSIRPGMSVRPPPSMTTVSARRSAGIGVVEILSILLPMTRTFVGGESVWLLPSNTRTFWNKTFVTGGFRENAETARQKTQNAKEQRDTASQRQGSIHAVQRISSI